MFLFGPCDKLRCSNRLWCRDVTAVNSLGPRRSGALTRSLKGHCDALLPTVAL